MPDQNLLNYIQQLKAAKKSRLEIEAALKDAGWQDSDIQENLNAVFGQTAQPTVDSAPLKGVWQLFKETKDIYFRNFWTLMIITAPTLIIHLLSNWIITEKNTNLVFYILAIIASLLATLIWVWIVPSLIIAISKESSYKQSFKEGLTLFPLFLWVLFLQIIILYGATLLLIIPGIIIGVYLGMAPYTAVLDRMRGLAALQKSRQLVKGKFWKVTWRWIGIALFAMLFIFGISLISFLAEMSGVLLNTEILDAILIYTVIFLSISFIVAYGFVLYRDLVRVTSQTGSDNSRQKRWPYVMLGFLGMPVLTLFLFFQYANIIAKDIPEPKDDVLQLENINVNPNENAFQDFIDAVEVFRNVEVDQEDIDKLYNSFIGKVWDRKFVEEGLEINKQALSLWDQGVRKQYVQDPSLANPQILDFETPITIWDPARFLELARLKTLKARLLMQQGDEEAAFEESFSIIKAGQMMEEGQNGLLANLIGQGVKDIGFISLRNVISSTTLSRNELQTFSMQLDAYQENREGIIKAFKVEYTMLDNSKEEIDLAIQEQRNQSVWQKIVSPIYPIDFYYQPNRTVKYFVDFWSASINNAEGDCYEMIPIEPLTEGIRSPIWKLMITPNASGLLIRDTTTLIINVDQLIKEKCDAEFSWAATKLFFGLKTYKEDIGNLPVLLEGLVPAYIEEIPKDPYDGKSIKYDSKKSILYSIGSDLKDDGGSETTEETTKYVLMEDPTIRIKF